MRHKDTGLVRIRPSFGFTLIEVMIVVSIVGLLAAVAVPSYNEYIVRTNRADAKSLLADIIFEQERYNTRNRTYTEDLTDLGYDNDPVVTANGFYQISAEECELNSLTTCIELTADPVAGGPQVDDGELSLDTRGTREPAEKWRK